MRFLRDITKVKPYSRRINVKKFYIGENKYLEHKVLAFYNCDYVGYQKQGNPDFINHLKNMTNQYNELDLVEDFVQVSERFVKDMESVFDKADFKYFTVCVMPRSKRESKYKQSQLIFKKQFQVALTN